MMPQLDRRWEAKRLPLTTTTSKARPRFNIIFPLFTFNFETIVDAQT
jgi:hypothetical protein